MSSTPKRSITNTILITDPNLIQGDNGHLLDELIDSVKEAVSNKQEKLTVTKLPFFQKCVLVFQNKITAEEIYKKIVDQQIKCGFAPRDTKFEFSNLKSESASTDTQSTLLNSEQGLYNNSNNNDTEESPFLQIPERHIELQSPPASPYLGYIPHQPEEAPDIITITDPESLSHILYQPTIDNLDKEKVFENERQVDSIDIDVPIFVLNRSAAEDLKRESSSRQQ